MLHFRTRAEAEAAPVSPEERRCIVHRIQEFEAALAELGAEWQPDEDGHFSLVTTEEAALPLEGMGWRQRLVELLYESVHFHPEAQLWEAVFVPGNNWGWTVFVPDSPQLPADLRELFLREAAPEEAALVRRSPP